MTEEQQGVALCKGPCMQPTQHVTIERVVRWQQPIQCRVCGTVQSIPKASAANAH